MLKKYYNIRKKQLHRIIMQQHDVSKLSSNFVGIYTHISVPITTKKIGQQ